MRQAKSNQRHRTEDTAGMTATIPTYELHGLTKRYGRGETIVTALDGVDLIIEQGEFIVIAGPSGSGKTTMLQLLGGLDRPDAGTLMFEGRDMNALNDYQLTMLRLEAIGFVFQQFNLIPTLTAQENVEAALAPTAKSSKELHSRSRELLTRVGLAERADHLPSQLSGGEQQRVAIARALAHEPRVVLADEPTGNLDSKTGSEVLSLLRALSAEGLTVMLITHDVGIAAEAPRVLRMKDGRVVDAEELTA